jgi:hypothetical protein
MNPKSTLSGRPVSASAYSKRTDKKAPEMAQIHVSFAELSAALLLETPTLRMEDLKQKFNAAWPTIAPTFGLDPNGFWPWVPSQLVINWAPVRAEPSIKVIKVYGKMVT